MQGDRDAFIMESNEKLTERLFFPSCTTIEG